MTKYQLSPQRLDTLYALANDWSVTAFEQARKNRENGTSVTALLDKLSSEVIEAERELRYHDASMKKHKYRDEALEELCDVGNMGLILMSVPFDGPNVYPSYRFMLVSAAYHQMRYGFNWTVPFDLSASYSEREIFDIYMKTVDSMAAQWPPRTALEGIERFHMNYLMLHKDMDEFLEQRGFPQMAPHIQMASKWVRMTGDVIFHSMMLLGDVDAGYEEFFQRATKKMRERDKRYHTLNRKE